MAVGYNPRAITDGLVLSLDAGNPKNYNAGISTNWTDKVGGNNGTLVGGTNHNDGPFVGAGYVEFDGTDDYVAITNTANLRLGNEDFTIESWVQFGTGLSVSESIFGVWDNTNNQRSYLFYYYADGDDLYFSASSDGTGSGITNVVANNVGFTANRWYHLVASRISGTTTIYIDGVSSASGTQNFSFYNNTTDTFAIGAANVDHSITNQLKGKISNLRIVKGTALYTSNFTPPTKPLTAVTNTVLLTCQGNTIVDASSSGHTITANGDISITKEPFAGAGAVAFDGTSDYLDIASSTDFAFGTGDFTIEVWVYLKSNTLGVIYSNEVANSLFLYLSSGNLVVRNYGTTNLFDLTAPSLNTWTHIALSRSGTDLRLFFNGVQQGSTVTNSTNWTQNGTEIGAYSNGSQSLNGYMSNLRVVKGTALYTSNFTPPSRTLEPIENTVLLTCQGQNIKDASSSAHTITPNGDVKATIVSSAFEFDGTGDYVQMDSSTDTDLSGDFTIEAWVYPTANGESSNSEIVSRGAASTLNGWHFAVANGTTRLFFGVNYAGTTAAVYTLTSGSMTLNSWNHVAVTRSGDTVRIFIDGSLDVTNSSATGRPTVSGTEYVYVGRGSYDLGNREFNGKISAVKIYKGKSLSTAEVLQNYNATKGRYA